MSGQPLVSIIMIFLNGERFIEEAIASVFAQTWPHWELLLVDDGSSDRSPAIAKAWAERRPERVRYLQHADGANHGTGPSRNLGLDHARGEYIAFLDADDVFLPERLARHVAMLEARPEVGAVQSKMLIWHSWRGADVAEAPNFIAPALPFTPGSVVEPPGLLLLLLETAAGSSPGVCNVTVRHRLATAVGGFDDSFRGLNEDDAFFSKLYLEVRVGLLGECLAWYRQHPESCTKVARRNGTSRPGGFGPARQFYLRWLESYLVRRGVRDRRVLDTLARHAWPLRHPRLNRLIMLVQAFAGGAIRTVRATARLALPASAYGRLLRWRGGQKKSRSQSRRERAVGRISRYVIDA